jgi:mono/diheme cytochrome c family protein
MTEVRHPDASPGRELIMAEVLEQQSQVERTTLPPVLVPVPVPPSPGLSRRRRMILFAAPVVALLLSWGAGAGLYYLLTAPPAPAVVDRGPPDGARLYSQNCARCHGELGDGNGFVLLDPKSRHFGFEKFKLGTTKDWYGPTDDDLLRIVTRGIPGSAMPAFDQLPEADRRAIVGHVRMLTWKGAYDRLKTKAVKDEGDYDPVEVAEKAAAATRVGQPLEVPALSREAAPEALAHGREVFLKNCAQCHGLEGRGDGPQVNDPNFKNDNGTPARPRDLTQGLYKGGGEPDQLYARIVLGIPGTPMPATNTLPAQDVADLIAYVRSLPGRPADGAAVAGR